MPERAVITYRDALLHRVELAEHGLQCELDKAAARGALQDSRALPQEDERRE